MHLFKKKKVEEPIQPIEEMEAPPAPPEFMRKEAARPHVYEELPPLKLEERPELQVPNEFDRTKLSIRVPELRGGFELPPPPEEKPKIEFKKPVVEKPVLKKPEIKEAKEPLFVELDDYKVMLDQVSKIRTDLKTAQTAMENLNNLKNTQELELGRWRAQVEDIQKKLIFVDKILFERA